MSEPSQIVQALVGLKDVRVLFYERRGPQVELVIEQVVSDPRCPSCGGPARVKERPSTLVIVLITCAPSRGPGKCRQPQNRAPNSHTDDLTRSVMTYGEALLAADRRRLNAMTAIGLDETSFVKLSTQPARIYATTVADVANHQIIEILPTRSYVDVAGWIDTQPASWKQRIIFGALDMSNTYAAVYTVMLPQAQQVVDAFHCVQLANRALDDVRRRVQRDQKGHRGRRDDPLYRVRRALLAGEERLNDPAAQRLASLLALGDPHGEVAIAYRAKERLRELYRTPDIDAARTMLGELVEHCLRPAMPPELRKLGATLRKWFDKICN